jgi:transporter family-2 protein
MSHAGHSHSLPDGDEHESPVAEPAVARVLWSVVGVLVGLTVIATIVNFGVGLAGLLLLALASGARVTPGSAAAVPAWAWFGGLLGAAYVAATTVLGPRLGAAALIALTLAGQMVAALIVDHYGVIGFPQNPVTPARLAGAALLVVGVLLIVRR